MIIFLKQRYVDQVIAGTKTSTIRPWATCHLRPGADISFNGRTHVVCTAVERLRLADLSDTDIRADGFGTRAAFIAAFQGFYPHATPDTPVWVIRFALPSK